MKGSENIKKVSIAHLMNCLIFQFNKKRTTRYDRQIVFMEIHKGFLWVYVFKKFWVKCFCHKFERLLDHLVSEKPYDKYRKHGGF